MSVILVFDTLLSIYLSIFASEGSDKRAEQATLLPNTMGIIEKLQAKIELYRLEQRYARRKHRTSFHDVQYVDGEYVFNSSLNSPTSSVSKHSTGGHGKSSTWSASNESRWRWWLISSPFLVWMRPSIPFSPFSYDLSHSFSPHHVSCGLFDDISKWAGRSFIMLSTIPISTFYWRSILICDCLTLESETWGKMVWLANLIMIMCC